MIEPIQAQWNIRRVDGQPVPAPYVTTSGFAVDPQGYFPLLYRGPHVRSAKNAWSIPSGLHECGFTLQQQLGIELKEELNLDSSPLRSIFIGTYENIAAVDNWHWVISVFVIPVETLDTMVNSEPDKHPEIRKFHVSQLETEEFRQLVWAPCLGPFIQGHLSQIKAAMQKLI